jgi:hypothetical protein
MMYYFRAKNGDYDCCEGEKWACLVYFDTMHEVAHAITTYTFGYSPTKIDAVRMLADGNDS